MYGDILRGIEGIGIFPIISLVLFVAVFTVVLLWALRADRTRLDRHAALPLDSPVEQRRTRSTKLFDPRSAGSGDRSLRARRME